MAPETVEGILIGLMWAGPCGMAFWFFVRLVASSSPDSSTAALAVAKTIAIVGCVATVAGFVFYPIAVYFGVSTHEGWRDVIIWVLLGLILICHFLSPEGEKVKTSWFWSSVWLTMAAVKCLCAVLLAIVILAVLYSA